MGNSAKKCDICGQNPATMRVRQVDKNGKATELEVCQECASKRGLLEAGKISQTAAELLAEMKGKVAAEDKNLVCPRCGMSFADFKRLGRLGCEVCYDGFGSKLEPIIRRIHGSSRHVGKVKKSGLKQAQLKVDVQHLRKELQAAIHAEDYEEAARIRDQLKQAEDGVPG